MLDRVIHRIKRLFLRSLIRARKISIPGFDRIPLYDVMLFFYRSMVDGSLTTRASAIAFSFFLALFPAIIFLFTLIPYIPIRNFQAELFLLIRDILPASAFDAVEETIQDILTRQRGGLLSLGFFMALIFASNGLITMMNAFDSSLHTIEKRNWVEQRMISVILLLVLSVLLALAIALIIAGQYAINYLDKESSLIGSRLTYYLLSLGRWLITISLFFFAYSSLYFFAPAKKTRWRFISPGGTLATILSIIVMTGFGYYITNFGQYNKLYGSIGTLLVILLLCYLLSLILLIGFELNNSINAARRKIIM